jgi:hypothetical protein
VGFPKNQISTRKKLIEARQVIYFGGLVFEHTGDLNFKVIEVKSLQSLRTIKEVTTPSGQSFHINLEVQLMAPNYEEPDQEVVESPPVFTT